MRAPSLFPYCRDLASIALAAHEVHQAFADAEAADLVGDKGRVARRLDDGVEAARRMLRLAGYEVTPDTARRAGGV